MHSEDFQAVSVAEFITVRFQLKFIDAVDLKVRFSS